MRGMSWRVQQVFGKPLLAVSSVHVKLYDLWYNRTKNYILMIIIKIKKLSAESLVILKNDQKIYIFNTWPVANIVDSIFYCLEK